jgi:chloride channel 7
LQRHCPTKPARNDIIRTGGELIKPLQDSELDRRIAEEKLVEEHVVTAIMKWFLSIIIGFLLGCLAFCVDASIEYMVEFKLSTIRSLIGCQQDFLMPLLTFVAFSACLAFVAGSLVSFVAPLAAGSGIPEMKTYLNGIHLDGLMCLRTLLAKLVGVVFSISAGLVAGKEGPFVHGGGIIGGGVASMGSMALSKFFNR